MVKFAINDIRLFWTEDKRFSKQFKAGKLDTKFQPYSKYPPCFKVKPLLLCILPSSICLVNKYSENSWRQATLDFTLYKEVSASLEQDEKLARPYNAELEVIESNCMQDVSFWLPEDGFTENNLCEVVRDVAGDLVESVTIVDQFTHPKTKRESNCFRVAYRSMDRSLTDDEINRLQEQVRSDMVGKLSVELR